MVRYLNAWVPVAAFALFAVCPNAFSAPRFVTLKQSSPSYSVGSRAILTAYLQISPENPNYEIFLTSQFAGKAIKTTRISDSQAVSITPYFTGSGSFDWVVHVSIQDRKAAHGFEATIAFYNDEIYRLRTLLATETDPDTRKMLQDEISRDQTFLNAASAQLSNTRRLVETDSLTLTVNPAKLSASDAPPIPVFDIRTGHDCDYKVGEQATFLMHLNTAFAGEDGPREAVMRANLDGKAMSVIPLGPMDFSSATSPFTSADIGNHAFSATLFVRSKAQADSLRDAVEKASATRARYIALRDSSSDAMERAYDQRQIDDLTDVINEFYRQLEEILVKVGTQTDTFSVSAASNRS